MDMLFILLIFLFLARSLGELANIVGQPALIGEISAGILIGLFARHYAEIFPFLSHISENNAFTLVTDLAIFFLMLEAGLEMAPKELTSSSLKSMSVAFFGTVLPLGLGLALGSYYIPDSPYKLAQVFFVGICLAVTAVPVTMKILADIGQQHTSLGRLIASAAIYDDLLSLFLLAALTGVVSTGKIITFEQITLIIGNAAIFVVITVLIGHFFYPRFWNQTFYKFKGRQFDFSILLLFGLAFSALSEFFGLHFIIGAFVAGLFFVTPKIVSSERHEDLKKAISGVTDGFLTPIFFVSVGLRFSFEAIWEFPTFVALLIFMAFIGKIVGCGGAAYFAGFKRNEAFAIGFGMNARGSVELIVVDVALRAGILTNPVPTPPLVSQLFSAVVTMALVTTLVTPFALKRLLQEKDVAERI